MKLLFVFLFIDCLKQDKKKKVAHSIRNNSAWMLENKIIGMLMKKL